MRACVRATVGSRSLENSKLFHFPWRYNLPGWRRVVAISQIRGPGIVEPLVEQIGDRHDGHDIVAPPSEPTGPGWKDSCRQSCPSKTEGIYLCSGHGARVPCS